MPESHYMKLYDALFKSHLSYCINCWGGIPKSKLDSLFAVQKRCIRILFGKLPSFDHAEFYETCARARTYQQHIADKDYSLEHTKALFNEQNILSLHHLYIQHIFIDMFKILKLRVPYPLFDLFDTNWIRSSSSMRLRLPLTMLDKTKANFVYSGCLIWNKLINRLLEDCLPGDTLVIVPGSCPYTDLYTTPISFVKTKLKCMLIDVQKKNSFGNTDKQRSSEWNMENFFTFRY